MTTKAHSGDHKGMNMQCRPRGVRAAGYCARAPLPGALVRTGGFLRASGKKVALHRPASMQVGKKRGSFSSSRQCGRVRGAALKKEGGSKKSPFVEPVIDVQEAPRRSLWCTGPLGKSKNSKLRGDAFPSRLFLNCKKVTDVMQ